MDRSVNRRSRTTGNRKGSPVHSSNPVIAVPMIGDMISSTLATVIVIPATRASDYRAGPFCSSQMMNQPHHLS